jgi:hypothetical protein
MLWRRGESRVALFGADRKKDGSRTWATPRVQAAFRLRPGSVLGDADFALTGRDERRASGGQAQSAPHMSR